MTLREHWEFIWEKNHDYYPEFLATDPFAGRDKSRMPQSVAEVALHRGVQILTIKPRHPDGLGCVRRARRIAERAAADDVCRTRRCVPSYPLNLAKLSRTAAVSAFIETSRTDADLPRRASELFAEWTSRQLDTDQNQAYHLGGVRAAILAGDRGAARGLLRDAPPPSSHGPEVEAFRAVCDPARDAGVKLAEVLSTARRPRHVRTVFTERDALAFDLSWVLSSGVGGGRPGVGAVVPHLVD